MASFAFIAATQNSEVETAAQRQRLIDRASGRTRWGAGSPSDDESSEGEESDDDSIDEEVSIDEGRVQERGLSSTFLGTTINYDRSPQMCVGNFFGAAVSYETHPQRDATLQIDTARNDTHAGQSNRAEEATQRPNKEAISSDGPPTPWGSSTAKKTIVAELKEETSDIHLLVGNYTTTDFSKVNFRQILQQYAGNKQYKMSNFRENVKRLLRHLLAKTGPFKPEKIEPWYTSAKNVSRGYALLFALYMDPEESRKLAGMSAEQIWRSHPQFRLYDLEKFVKHNKDMKELTDKRKVLISDEEACYRRDLLKLPERSGTTSRGIPFWHTHAASDLLQQHVAAEMDGSERKRKPQQLWKSRAEYQEFPLKVFRKHIYQERTKQLAVPYWQHKRNKSAQKKYEEKGELLKDWNREQMNRRVDGLAGAWGRMNLND